MCARCDDGTIKFQQYIRINLKVRMKMFSIILKGNVIINAKTCKQKWMCILNKKKRQTLLTTYILPPQNTLCIYT